MMYYVLCFKGTPGDDGRDGINGTDGTPGADGRKGEPVRGSLCVANRLCTYVYTCTWTCTLNHSLVDKLVKLARNRVHLNLLHPTIVIECVHNFFFFVQGQPGAPGENGVPGTPGRSGPPGKTVKDHREESPFYYIGTHTFATRLYYSANLSCNTTFFFFRHNSNTKISLACKKDSREGGNSIIIFLDFFC